MIQSSDHRRTNDSFAIMRFGSYGLVMRRILGRTQGGWVAQCTCAPPILPGHADVACGLRERIIPCVRANAGSRAISDRTLSNGARCALSADPWQRIDSRRARDTRPRVGDSGRWPATASSAGTGPSASARSGLGLQRCSP